MSAGATGEVSAARLTAFALRELPDMCGIAGVLEAGPARAAELGEAALRMTAVLRHRGPDDGDVWVDAGHGVALGHRRLAVLDLSERARQPMRSPCGRYTIVLNGEIYNFRALRSALERRGCVFRTTGDTEVLLAAIVSWGLRGALERCTGMFAFALWDERTARLHLVRDRVGEKPLYYGWDRGRLLFASELKGLRAHLSFRPVLDRGALALYLRLGFVPGPHSIYEGVRKLPPGSVLTVGAGETSAEPVAYWSWQEVVARAVDDPFHGDMPDAVEALDELLRDAVRLRLEADVPLGAFLSGGVDSTAVVAVTQAVSARPVRTYTVSFPDPGYDEATHAWAVARHLGTHHTEIPLAPGDVLDAIPTLPRLYDEPFADPSQLPTALITAAARREVTVCLSGDGGDEAFGGYNRYRIASPAWTRVRRTPHSLRRFAARALLLPSHGAWEAADRRVGGALPARLRQRNTADKLQKLARVLQAGDDADLYRVLVSQWDHPARLLVDAAEEPASAAADGRGAEYLPSLAERMMFTDLVTELPDCMLVKVDRASMGVGLEVRVPLLDHRLVEFAWRLPLWMRVADGGGKRVLRGLVDRYVPRDLMERPKMGFDPPIGAWLRGPLREWAETLLDRRRLADGGLLDPDPIRRRWDEHLRRRRNWDYSLWAVLMLESWRETASVGTAVAAR